MGKGQPRSRGKSLFSRFMKLDDRIDQAWEPFIEFFNAKGVDDLNSDLLGSNQTRLAQDLMMKGDRRGRDLLTGLAAAHAVAIIKCNDDVASDGIRQGVKNSINRNVIG